MKVIHTDQAPAAVGPYSQAIEAKGVLYCSGQIAINPAEGKIVATTMEAGTDMSHVVKTTCFLAEIADFKAFNEVYAKHFISKPARSCVAVKDLPAGALCEVEVTAVL